MATLEANGITDYDHEARRVSALFRLYRDSRVLMDHRDIVQDYRL